jgi:flagellar biosynthesis protein FliR
MALLPAFGDQAVPQRVRLVLALAFTVIVAPAVTPLVSRVDAGALPLLAEIVVGLGIGISMRMLILALQMAGAIVAQATSLAQMFAGSGAEPQTAIGQLLTMAGLALAVALGLHVHVVQFLILSYDILPPGQMPEPGDLANWGLAQSTRAFSLAFSLAAPFVIAATIYNLATGIINRAMPQLMVAMVGAPALTAGGLVLLALVAPLVLSVWIAALESFLQAPFSLP